MTKCCTAKGNLLHIDYGQEQDDCYQQQGKQRRTEHVLKSAHCTAFPNVSHIVKSIRPMQEVVLGTHLFYEIGSAFSKSEWSDGIPSKATVVPMVERSPASSAQIEHAEEIVKETKRYER